jgi:hypothetical protein
MGYLGAKPSISSQLIADSVTESLQSALTALKPDPATGELVFDEEKMDQIIEDLKDDQGGLPIIIPLIDFQQPLPVTSGNELIEADPGGGEPVLVDTAPTESADFVVSPGNGNGNGTGNGTGNGGGGMFPLLALGLLAYLGSK